MDIATLATVSIRDVQSVGAMLINVKFNLYVTPTHQQKRTSTMLLYLIQLCLRKMKPRNNS